MKILAICGSPRKGNSYKALNEIRASFPQIDYEILQLNDLNFNLCKGAMATMVSRIEKGEKDKPSLSMMIPFNIFKYVSELDKDVMTADFDYYKASIPFYKKFIAKKVSNKIVSQFD